MALLLCLVNGPVCSGDAMPREGAEQPVTILAFGDSLTAGFGLPQKASFPARLQAYLRERGVAATVINAGVSGDTSSGGRARIDWALQDPVDLVLVELGANDALRGLDPAVMEHNLDAIIRASLQAGARVVLAGMRSPANWGAGYSERFEAVYPRLAEKHGIFLYPFFLEKVAGVPAYNQEDGIHPNAQGVLRIVEGIGPMIEDVVRDIITKRQEQAPDDEPSH